MSTPTPDLEAVLQDAVFARKLALALLSVLQDKNILSEQDLAIIIAAARRSTLGGAASAASAREEVRALMQPYDAPRREPEVPAPPLLDLEL